MLTKEQLLDITSRYNYEESGIKRTKYLDKLVPYLDRKEIMVIKGVRRCGKSTILKQLINHLLNAGVERKQVMYVNFDDFNFLPYLNLELLELILSSLVSDKKCYLFLDEIQRVPQFESWLKTYYDRERNVKFIISGSSSTILSKEMGTLLTGRNLTFEIYPLDYCEYLTFNGGSFEEYLTYGGFPEVVLEKSHEKKISLLSNYISNILNKDVIEKRKVRNSRQITLFTSYILKNPGLRISINKLSSELDLSKETVVNYLDYLKDAYVIFEVSFFSYSAKSKFVKSNVPKYYVIDNGFYTANSSRQEMGKLYEAVIAQKLLRESKGLVRDIFYWKDKNEVNFVYDNTAINVVAIDDVPDREIHGLTEIKAKHKNIKRQILVVPSNNKKENGIEIIAIREFLISS